MTSSRTVKLLSVNTNCLLTGPAQWVCYIRFLIVSCQLDAVLCCRDSTEVSVSQVIHRFQDGQRLWKMFFVVSDDTGFFPRGSLIAFMVSLLCACVLANLVETIRYGPVIYGAHSFTGLRQPGAEKRLMQLIINVLRWRRVCFSDTLLFR